MSWQLLHCFLSLFNLNFASISCIVDFMLFMITFRELISILKCSRSAFCEAFTATSSARNCSMVQFISCSLRSSSDGDKVGVFSCSLCTLSEGDSKVGVVSCSSRASTEGDRVGVVSSSSRASTEGDRVVVVSYSSCASTEGDRVVVVTGHSNKMLSEAHI